MADGRDVKVWDNHANQCREADRDLFTFDAAEKNSGGWLRDRVELVLTAGSSVIDVGCGPGYWRNLFKGMEYTGLDQSQGMLDLAAEVRDNVTSYVVPPKWVLGSGRDLTKTIPLSSYDMAFTASVLQHNRNEPDKREIVEGVHDILKPKGYLLCTENTYRKDNCPQSVGNPDFTDGYSMTPEGWEKYMLPLGFKMLFFNGQSEYLFQKVK